MTMGDYAMIFLFSPGINIYLDDYKPQTPIIDFDPPDYEVPTNFQIFRVKEPEPVFFPISYNQMQEWASFIFTAPELNLEEE